MLSRSSVMELYNRFNSEFILLFELHIDLEVYIKGKISFPWDNINAAWTAKTKQTKFFVIRVIPDAVEEFEVADNVFTAVELPIVVAAKDAIGVAIEVVIGAVIVAAV